MQKRFRGDHSYVNKIKDKCSVMYSEVKIQSQIFQWHWNNYPEERGLLCYNLNNSANKIQGNQNKALGLIKGRSDMVYYYNGTAVMIELKNATGKQSKEQIAMGSNNQRKQASNI